MSDAARACEELMDDMGLNAATKHRVKTSGLAASRLYVLLRDSKDERPRRPGGYVWALVKKELEGVAPPD